MADEFDPYYTWLGIPARDQPATHYRLLGVELFEGNPDVIENAADRQMAHVRSFQNGPHGDVSQKLLNEITVARLCLLNQDKKAEYDARLRAEKEAAEAAARPRARAVRAAPIQPADPAQPFDEARDIIAGGVGQSGAAPVPAPLLSLNLDTPQPAAGGPTESLPPPSRRRSALAPALIAGVAGGVLVVAIVAFLVLRGGSRPTADETGPGTTPPPEPLGVVPDPKTPVRPPSKTLERPPELPQPTTKSPRPARAETQAGLRLVGRDYVELDGTAEIGGDSGPKEYVWMEDEIPRGARASGEESKWSFVESPQPVFRGRKAVRRVGDGQIYFGNLSGREANVSRLVVGEGDRLFTHVYLDPKDPPTGVLLEFYDGTWEHRAYWGDDTWGNGTRGTPSRRAMGKLPKAGAWVRLEVPADLVGIDAGNRVEGFTFAQRGGTVYWDSTGIVSRTPQEGLTGTPLPRPKEYVWIEDEPPAGAHLEGNTPWEFVTKPHPVFSGQKSTRRSCTDPSQHFFHGADPGLTVGEGDR